jgi:peptidoglycan lytic transglycosylase
LRRKQHWRGYERRRDKLMQLMGSWRRAAGLVPLPAATLTTTAGIAIAATGGAHERQRSHTAFHVAKHNLMVSEGVWLHGVVNPGGGRRVKIVVRGPVRGQIPTASERGGAFSVRWRAPRPGVYRFRAFAGGNARAASSVSPSRRVTASRTAHASYYGPGLYGGALACGGSLQPNTLGVAHQTLPCGAKVTLRYHGRSVRVPVIDRGPHVGGRDYDLTEETKERLGFPSTSALLASR